MNNRKLPSRLIVALILWTAVCLANLVFLAVPATSDGRGKPASANTQEGRLAVFDDVWETINERYYDPAFKGFDWSAPRSEFRKAAAEARGSAELYAVLRRMIESLNDPHTRVYSPDKKSDWWQPRFVTVGLAIREVEGLATVVQVEPNSAPARAGLKPGDAIESVDEVPVSQLIKQKVDSQLATANRSVRSRVVAMLLEGEAGSLVQLRWKGKNGRVKTATFPRYLSQKQLGFHTSRRDGFLVVEIATFTQALMLDLLRDLRGQLGNARGVILDLRNNGGGDAHAMASFASVFLATGIGLGGFTDRAGTTFQLLTHSKSLLASQPVTETNLPVVVLISERTSSAAEILASALQLNRRARVVGTNTCGCVLAIRSRHILPDDGVLDVSEFDYRTATGIRLEGRGIEPDDLLLPQRRDLYHKRDSTFETAVAWLKRNAKR